MNNSDTLTKLFETIKQRQKDMPKGSYTTKLFKKGKKKICQKLGEEASEVIIASLAEGRDEFIYESADLIYHLLVLMAKHEVKPEEVFAELERRMQDK